METLNLWSYLLFADITLQGPPAELQAAIQRVLVAQAQPPATAVQAVLGGAQDGGGLVDRQRSVWLVDGTRCSCNVSKKVGA